MAPYTLFPFNPTILQAGAELDVTSTTFNYEERRVHQYEGGIGEMIPENVEVVIIADNVRTIREKAFWNCGKLHNVIMGRNVERIEAFAFNGCEALETINLTKSNMLQSIGEDAFFFCTSLRSLSIPSTVTDIGDYAFSYCTALKHLIIPPDVNVGRRIVDGCNIVEIQKCGRLHSNTAVDTRQHSLT